MAASQSVNDSQKARSVRGYQPGRLRGWSGIEYENIN